MSTEKWTEIEIRRVAAESLVDIRTVRKYVAGEKVRASVVERIKMAAQQLKLRTNA
jgi:hypothetical protein